ncbi:MAG: hypothetical protein KDD50_08330 [Bdellovibrionales bacterium]|nr:hypothetical protein [Bdellovibrionales bacterium]
MRLTILIFLFLTLSNCVSIEIPEEKIVKDKNVQFKPPGSPFIKADDEHVDRSWRNPKNGNTISFMSDCSQTTDPRHKTLHSEILNGMTNVHYIEQKFVDFNQRKGLNSVVSGSVDGVSTQLNIQTLKKNYCIYIITYVTLTEHYSENASEFQKFLDNFKVRGLENE